MDIEKTELRYLDLKNDICSQIYRGVYLDGERIPSERQLAVDYDVSRITVRKALELLEEEDMVQREVGSGTIVRLRNWGNDTSLDMIGLVAPSQNPFFAKFIAEFQKIAWEQDALLLYVEIPENTSLEDCLYRLYEKNIRNVVVWPDDQAVNKEKLLRLRSIGMNFVFFDTDDAYPYADSVYLDNEDAVRKLMARADRAYDDYYYVGWNKLDISNVKRREVSFRGLCPKGKIIRVPWRQDRKMEEADIKNIIKETSETHNGVIFCGAGELGQQIAEELYFTESPDRISMAVIDDFEGADKFKISIYNQDMASMAKSIYQNLKEQIKNGKTWKAKRETIKGIYL